MFDLKCVIPIIHNVFSNMITFVIIRVVTVMYSLNKTYLGQPVLKELLDKDMSEVKTSDCHLNKLSGFIHPDGAPCSKCHGDLCRKI